MDLTSCSAYWPIKNGLLASFPSLEENLSCEVAVVGRGITGSLIAHHLCAASIDAVVVDKRDIGTGSSSGSTGLLQYEIDVPLSELIGRIGEKNAVRSYQLCSDAIDKIHDLTLQLKKDCGFRRKKSLYLASTRKDVATVRQEFEVRRKHKINLEFLNRSEIESRFSFSRPAALYSEKGGQIDPHRLTHALLEKGVTSGLRVFDRTPIVKFESRGNGLTLTSNQGYKIKARRMVLSAGFETKSYLKRQTGKLKSTYALISEPVPAFAGWYDQCLIWESARPYLYLRTTDDKRIIAGGEDEDFLNPKKRDELIGQKTKTLVRKFQKMFPEIKMEVAYSWAGTFAETKDGLPYIGTVPEIPRTYLAMDYGGNGITCSVIAAEIIRDNYLGKENLDAGLFRFDR